MTIIVGTEMRQIGKEIIEKTLERKQFKDPLLKTEIIYLSLTKIKSIFPKIRRP